MASKFQSRLVGTIILVAVGVIVLPDLLDGQKLHYKEDFASIPIKPELNSQAETFAVLDPIEDDISLPESPVNVVINEAEKFSEAKPLDVVITQPVEKNAYQDSAWIIQLMTLSNAENAEKVVEDLRSKGYQAHTKQKGTFTQVMVGPDVSKTKLESQVIELKKDTGEKGQIIKFRPLNP
ncbi:cell division protein DedD [Vibrio sp. 10N.286.49.B3]|uniref:SPOR domain-containing protein n=1 Tax=Vibrio sp. 10N.286.49.B3 TaxID=1880855 RepID=UPI000C82AFEC|nr:SPOR domain-containing protein [Vibrio sp. 10N.286.49.B3]PMH40576.1 cell division protein DedD [Vibrio sp. 10N.286.49.B3]